MAKDNVIPSQQGFTRPSLATADGTEKQFTILRPVAALAREFFKHRRRYTALIDEYKELRAQEEAIDAKLLALVADDTADADKIAELRKRRSDFERLKEQSDIDLYKNLFETCAAVIDDQ